MLLQLVIAAASLGILYLGAELLVKGASRMAAAARISPVVVGLTVVAFGTSLPELSVSTLASLEGASDVALGNVVGSNIFNVAFILGLSTVVRPLPIGRSLLTRDMPLMVLVSFGLLGLAWDGELARYDAALLLLLFGAYCAFTFRDARATGPGSAASEPRPRAGRPRNLVAIVLGLGLLVGGGQLLIRSGTEIARALDVPELVIAVTLVAAGTSLPEFATSVVAAARRETEIAVGNIVGSNLFNILAILGVAALIDPLAVAEPALRYHLPVMVAVACLLLPLAITRSRLSRWEGVLLLGTYVAYCVALILVDGTR